MRYDKKNKRFERREKYGEADQKTWLCFQSKESWSTKRPDIDVINIGTKAAFLIIWFSIPAGSDGRLETLADEPRRTSDLGTL